MSRIIYLLIVVLSTLSFLQAEECSTIINQNEAVNIENARNQDGVGWCYAYAAADLLSYRLNKKISAVSLYNSGQSIEKDIATKAGNGGDIAFAISDYLRKKNSLCLEEDLPSSDFKFCSYMNYSEFLNSLYQSINEKYISNDQCLSENLKAVFPIADYNVIQNYTSRFGSKNLVEYLYDLQCKKQSFKGYKVNPVNQYLPRFTKDALLKNIDALLEKKEIVGFASQWDKLAETDDPAKTGGHATVIVGRRKSPDTGECEYLVRNSWGKSCDDMEGEGLTCDLACEGNQCRYTGHLWVSTRRIKNSILGITYLP
jgi:hypothetical protein